MPTESKKIISSKDDTLRPPPQFRRKERTGAVGGIDAETPHTSSNAATAANKPKSSSRTDASNTTAKSNKKRSGNTKLRPNATQSPPLSSSRTDDDAASSASNTTPNPNKKRSGNTLLRPTTTQSPTPLPDSSLPSQPKMGQYYNDVTTKQQGIEMITQKEALHHLEMAWRAQQRLVRRCLGLRLFGETQSSPGTNNNAGVGSGAGKKSHASKL
mmetsp:Transcript_32281/g.59187  ORF Transcript_32281/g.59187 Transcript_32281/m.59187 type:complete len:214 (-) Transcript_32281:1420-2061(-)|eukprot:CAMPEP_0201603760 /NCGR_PEP_ID=MMETSP0492-20130828/4105_1 /ASSEMBLY_ACC=CAM_ASM_000837 /TAXON_ID=420259 /ORGANISM="Thalassiosira gravida, Strain GMp14c1" /LENGTH=213 /DNA_ID=CAMNT_0048067613 /DNA_START=106 /DNA_END=747 /DNA_ORIENTATION=+